MNPHTIDRTPLAISLIGPLIPIWRYRGIGLCLGVLLYWGTLSP